MVEMTMELDAIVDFMNATQKILDEEKEGTNVVPINNVVHVDFFIVPEFEKLMKMRLQLPQVLAVYHDWADRTYALAMKNRGRLQRGKIRRYIEKCLAQVATIQRLFPNGPPSMTN